MLKMLNQQKGGTLLVMLLVIGLVAFFGSLAVLQRQLANDKANQQGQAQEARTYQLHQLSELLIQEITIRNVRFSTNSQLQQCLSGQGTPCDENISYEMILYAPNPPMVYQGGPWPNPPPQISRLAGGRNNNKLFLSNSGGPCHDPQLSEANSLCPLQPFAQFRPMCGGTSDAPSFQSTPGVCSGAANGFELTVGVAIYLNGFLSYKGDTTDTITFRFNTKQLQN